MSTHAKPGEGYLSPLWHDRLERFLFGHHTTLSVTALSSVLLSSLFIDDGLRSFVFDPFVIGTPITDEWLSAMLFITLGALCSIFFLLLALRFQHRENELRTCATYTAALLLFMTTIEYVLEWFGTNASTGGILLMLTLYYAYASFIVLLTTIREPSYMRKRIDTSARRSTRTIGAIIALSVTVNATLWYLLGDGAYSWAFGITTMSVLLPGLTGVGILKD